MKLQQLFEKSLIVTSKSDNNMDVANKLIDRAVEIAKEAGIKYPKRTNLSGAWNDDYFTVGYSTNDWRDTVITAAKDMGLSAKIK